MVTLWQPPKLALVLLFLAALAWVPGAAAAGPRLATAAPPEAESDGRDAEADISSDANCSFAPPTLALSPGALMLGVLECISVFADTWRKSCGDATKNNACVHARGNNRSAGVGCVSTGVVGMACRR